MADSDSESALDSSLSSVVETETASTPLCDDPAAPPPTTPPSPISAATSSVPLSASSSRRRFARRVLQLERDAGHECHPTREELRVGYHCMAEHDQWLHGLYHHVNGRRFCGDCWHADMPSVRQVTELLLQFLNLASVRVPLRGDVALGPGNVRMVLDAVAGLGALRSCHVQADVAGWVEWGEGGARRDEEAEEEEEEKEIARDCESRWVEDCGMKLTLLHSPCGSGDGNSGCNGDGGGDNGERAGGDCNEVVMVMPGSAWRLSQLEELETSFRVPFDDDQEEYEEGRGVWSHYLGLKEEVPEEEGEEQEAPAHAPAAAAAAAAAAVAAVGVAAAAAAPAAAAGGPIRGLASLPRLSSLTLRSSLGLPPSIRHLRHLTRLLAPKALSDATESLPLLPNLQPAIWSPHLTRTAGTQHGGARETGSRSRTSER
ncbi:unnamed protein product [Closterium sp. Naga37s-1]|nr:unnamed protein product [Closterium sp. Naga37s-1]